MICRFSFALMQYERDLEESSRRRRSSAALAGVAFAAGVAAGVALRRR